MMKSRLALGWLSLALLLTSGCMPVVKPAGPAHSAAYFNDHVYVTRDGMALKLSSWSVPQPKAIVVAVHGFNDYRRFFTDAAEYLRQQGISSYAYDQRGFGESPLLGYWAGQDAYADDLQQFSRLLKSRFPGVPIYWLGESMGGAIVIESARRSPQPLVDGIVLAAPAVWGRETMPWYQTMLLSTLSYTLPWLTLTGEGMGILPSDNIEMLRALGRDPLVIKATRVDAVHGLTDLMDAALASAGEIKLPTLLLYGKKDQIVPPEPTARFVEDLLTERSAPKTVTYYQNGYHMLLRDLQAPKVWADVVDWIGNRPSLHAAHNSESPHQTLYR